MNKRTNQAQITSHIVAIVSGTDKTTEEVWAQQIAGATKLALLANGSITNGTDDLVSSPDILSVVQMTQAAYEDGGFTPVATTLYVIVG